MSTIAHTTGAHAHPDDHAHGHPKDENGNMVVGSDLHTEFTGMKNTLLIQTSDAILVLQREKSQDVKKVYERLELERPDLV